MAKVGTISIDLIAHTGKLLAPIRKAQAAISSLGSRAGAALGFLSKTVAPLTALATGFLSTAAAIYKVKQAFSEIDEIGKRADRLGIATEKLIGLEHAAGLAGVSTEELGKALEFMMKQGLDVGELDSIADRIARMTDPVEKMQLILKTFGRAGSGMLNVFGSGSAGLRAMQEDAEKLGLTLSRIDAAKVEMANDAISRIGSMFSGIARKIAVELAPYLTALADYFVALGTEGEGWGEKVRAAINTMLAGISRLATNAQMVMLKITESWNGMADSMTRVIETALNSVIGKFKELQLGILEGFTALLGPAKFLGGDFRAFYIEMQRAAAVARREFETKGWEITVPIPKFDTSGLSGEDWGDMLNSHVDGIRAAAAESVRGSLSGIGEELEETLSTERLRIGAIERGTQEAMAAILATRSIEPIEQQQLGELKRQTNILSNIEKARVFVLTANLA